MEVDAEPVPGFPTVAPPAGVGVNPRHDARGIPGQIPDCGDCRSGRAEQSPTTNNLVQNR